MTKKEFDKWVDEMFEILKEQLNDIKVEPSKKD